MVKSSVFILVACLCVHLNDASLCKPLSTFRMDCNRCICSKNGMEYSCSDNVCPPKHHENYDVKETKDGYKLLVPKNSNQLPLDYSKFVLNRKHRVPQIPDGYPYINDEIPSSKESYTYEKENNNIDKRDNNDVDESDSNDVDESDSNDIDDKYNYDIDKKYKNDIAEKKEIEKNDLTFEEASENEDAERISEEADSDDNSEDDDSAEDDSAEDSNEDDDRGENSDSDEDSDNDEDIDRKNTVRKWRKIIPSARGRFHRE